MHKPHKAKPKKKQQQTISFTSRYKGILNVLQNEARISGPLKPQATQQEIDAEVKISKPYNAVWDTGATNTVISQKVVDDLNLKPIGMAKVQTANSVCTCEVFIVSVFLPSKVIMPSVRVTKGDMGGDILIGMDIMSKGDFAVSNHGGNTTFTFRMPSIEEIDFNSKKNPPVKSDKKVGRNDPCPCGSGKKYKKCHGRNA